jgi:receptor protein-tyrosine kinase
MNTAPKGRAHLVERAVEAMGGIEAHDLRPARQPGAAPAAPPRVPIQAPAERPATPAPPLPPPAAPTGVPIPMDLLVKAGLVAGTGGPARSRISEEIAVTQHAVLRTVKATPSVDGRCGRMVMIASARPGEGKTFTALNLAAAIAGSGARPVVLVDADGKHLSVSRLFGHAESPGLRMLAAEPNRPPQPLLVPTVIPRLSFLPYGPPPAGQPAAAPGPMMAAALARLAAALPDHIFVLDTPPCLSTSDASVLAPIVGQVVMVVEAERTQRAEVEAALDLVEACPNLQLLLNRAVLTANDTFGAYGGYDAYAAPPGG